MIINKIKILLVILNIVGLPLVASPSRIFVRTQSDFENLSSLLNNVIEATTNKVTVKFSPGTYYYSQSMISLSVQNSDLSLSFIGSNVTLVPKYTSEDIFYPSYFQFSEGKSVDLWSEVVQCTELITVVNETSKLCRIKVVDGITANTGDYIQLSQWYKTMRYKVVSVDADYIYFIADDLSLVNSSLEWNVNYDFIYAKRFPRYRVFHVKSNQCIHQSSVTTLFDISNAYIYNLTIRGISFMGSAGSFYSKGVINLNNVFAKEITIKDCRFTGCMSSCIMLENTSNIEITECIFNRNHTTCISAGMNCNQTSITKNLFDNNVREWNNNHVIFVQGANFLISDNVFRDFCYGAIGAGIWYKQKKHKKVSGIIANNEIYYTKEYNKDYLKHTLMDSGAIYLWTQLDDVTIQGNYIHDISGVVDNRGIFCDDGVKNVKIIKNLILRIKNCYCIDLREVPYVAEYVPDYNTNNHCFNNLLDGEIRFFIKDNSCTQGNNMRIGQYGYKGMAVYRKWKYKLK